jgi:hypothetical protein
MCLTLKGKSLSGNTRNGQLQNAKQFVFVCIEWFVLTLMYRMARIKAFRITPR